MPFRLKTIRARLFQLLIIAIGSMVLTTVLVWQFSIEPALRLSVAKGQREIARRSAEQIDGFISARIRDLEAAAEIGRFWEPVRDRQRQALYRLFKLAPEIQEVSLIAPDGEEQLRLSRLRIVTNDDLRLLHQLPVFRRAIGGQVSIGPVYYVKTAEPYISIAIPVKFTAADIRGVLKAEISLKSLWDAVSHIRVGESGHLYVVDRKGQLIAHPDYSKVLLGLDMSGVQEVEEFLESPHGDPGFGEVMRGADGEPVMSTYSSVSQTGWGVIVQEPLKTALADAQRLKRLATIALVLAVAGALFISYRFSRRLSDPVRDLEKGAELIAQGDLEHRLMIRTGDEIESLAGKFNRMAESLKESHRGLEAKIAERTREISSLYAALAPLSAANSLSGILQGVIQRVVDATGADAALIRLREPRTGFYFCPAADGFDDQYLETTKVVSHGSAVSTVFTNGRPIIAPDILLDQRLVNKRQAHSGFRSCAFLPLEVTGEVRGVIHLASRREGFFNSDKEAHLMAVARQMSIAIENHDLFTQTQRRHQEIQALYAIAETVARSLDLKVITQAALATTIDVLKLDAGRLYVFDAEERQLRLNAHYGIPIDQIEDIKSYAPGADVIGTIFEQNEPLIFPSLRQDPVFEALTRSGRYSAEESMLAVGLPITIKDRVVGVIHLYGAAVRQFDSQDMALLSAIGRQIGAAIENARLFEETVERARQQEALNAIAAATSQSLDLDKLFEIALAKVLEVTGRERVSIRLKDAATGMVTLAAYRGFSEAEIEDLRGRVPHRMTDRIFASGEPLVINESEREGDGQSLLPASRSVAWIPMKSGANVVGVMGVSATCSSPFSQREVDFLQAVGHVIGVALENVRLYENERHQVKSLRLLVDAARKLVGHVDIDALAQDILNTLVSSFGVRLAWIGSAEADGRVRPLYWAGDVAEYLKRVEIRWDESPLGHGPAGHAIRTGRPVVMDVATDPGFAPWREPALAHGYREVAAFPLMRGAKPFGHLILYSDSAGFFTAERVELVQTYANIATVALENARLFRETRQGAQEQQALNAIAAATSQSLRIDEVLQVAVDKVLEVTGREQGYIRLFDPAGGNLSLAAHRGISEDFLQTLLHERTPGGKSDQVLRSGEPLVINDPEGSVLKQRTRREGSRSMGWFPLKVRGTVVGIMNLSTTRPLPFQPREVELLKAIGNVIGVALENARLFQETQRNLERIRALHDIDNAIAQSLDLTTVLDVLLQKIELFLPCPASSTIRLFNAENGLLEPVACRNLDITTWKTWQGARGTANIVFETKAPIMIQNVQTDPRTLDREFFRANNLVSYLGVPLVLKDQVLGVLGFYTREERPFTGEEVEFLTTLAGQGSIAIHNSQLYGEVQKQAAELKQSNKVKDEFLSVISHELRTPLIAIMGYAGLMEDELMGKNTPDQAKAIAVIKKESDALLAMIRQILEATRLESGAAIVDRQRVDLVALLKELEESYALPLNKPVVLRWQYDASLPVVSTDSTKLKQVLQNLIGNAIKFTEEGFVTISVGHVADQEAVRFEVSDTGVGIAAEVLPLIFDKFRQVDSSDTRSYEGVGLGLFIAKKFIELLGGAIRVRSEPGHGSTFTVTVPCAAGAEAAKRLDDCVNL